MLFAGMDIVDALAGAPTQLLNVGENAEQIMLAGADEIVALRACLKALFEGRHAKSRFVLRRDF